MGELTRYDQGGVISLLHSGGGLTVPRPFEREIFLLETCVAGTSYVENICTLAAALEPGEQVQLVREPENPHDGLAILVRTGTGAKLGYVPRQDNPVFARLMDAGKFLFARVREKRWNRDWLMLRIAIFLRD